MWTVAAINKEKV